VSSSNGSNLVVSRFIDTSLGRERVVGVALQL
jgi:hypothetical protein